MTKLLEAAGFLLFSKAEPSFLLMKHAARWDLPKGHAESGETILQTALRETEEETGLAADLISADVEFSYQIEYDVVNKKRGDYRKRVTYFIGYLDQQFTPQLTEHVGYRWFDWPVIEPIQLQTIDPLLSSVAQHFQRYPERLAVDPTGPRRAGEG